MTNAPPKVIKLVQTFENNIEAYKSQPYNETQLRREFIAPFFEQLDWDVANKKAHAHKDQPH